MAFLGCLTRCERGLPSRNSLAAVSNQLTSAERVCSLKAYCTEAAVWGSEMPAKSLACTLFSQLSQADQSYSVRQGCGDGDQECWQCNDVTNRCEASKWMAFESKTLIRADKTHVHFCSSQNSRRNAEGVDSHRNAIDAKLRNLMPTMRPLQGKKQFTKSKVRLFSRWSAATATFTGKVLARS